MSTRTMAVQLRHLSRQDAAQVVRGLDVVVFDCDGVLWRGDRAVTGCAEALSSLRRAGKRLVFLTNSSSKSRSETRAKLDSFGLLEDGKGEGGIVVTSGFSAAQHLIRVLRLHKSPRPKVMALGGAGLQQELAVAGLDVVAPRAGDVAGGAGWSAGAFAALDPDPAIGAVVAGADPELTYAAVAQAALALQDPACAFIATNLDASVNVGTASRPRLMPEAGATVGAEWEVLQADDGSSYYYNASTGESQWEPPAGFGAGADAEGVVAIGAAGAWLALQDRNGTPYYYNVETRVTTWELPPDLEGAEGVITAWEAPTEDPEVDLQRRMKEKWEREQRVKRRAEERRKKGIPDPPSVPPPPYLGPAAPLELSDSSGESDGETDAHDTDAAGRRAQARSRTQRQLRPPPEPGWRYVNAKAAKGAAAYHTGPGAPPPATAHFVNAQTGATATEAPLAYADWLSKWAEYVRQKQAARRARRARRAARRGMAVRAGDLAGAEEARRARAAADEAARQEAAVRHEQGLREHKAAFLATKAKVDAKEAKEKAREDAIAARRQAGRQKEVALWQSRRDAKAQRAAGEAAELARLRAFRARAAEVGQAAALEEERKAEAAAQEKEARREARHRARREEKERKKREAEEQVRREVEARAREAAAERAKREAEEEERREAEARAVREEAEAAQRAVEERAAQRAAQRAQVHAQRKAKKDAMEKARRKQQQKAQEHEAQEAEERAAQDAAAAT
eukprot:g7565.t1